MQPLISTPLHRSFSKKFLANLPPSLPPSFLPCTLFNVPNHVGNGRERAYSDDPVLRAHNRRSCLSSDRGGDHSTVRNRSGTRFAGAVVSFHLLEGGKRVSDGITGRGEWKRVCANPSLRFQGCCTAKGCLPSTCPPWLNGGTGDYVFDTLTSLPGRRLHEMTHIPPRFVHHQPFELSNLELQSDRPAHAHLDGAIRPGGIHFHVETDRLGKRVSA